jgi:hypothetical protein
MGYPDGGLSQCPSGTELPPGMTCNLQGCTTQTCQAMVRAHLKLLISTMLKISKCANLGVPDPSPTCQWSPALSWSVIINMVILEANFYTALGVTANHIPRAWGVNVQVEIVGYRPVSVPPITFVLPFSFLLRESPQCLSYCTSLRVCCFCFSHVI